MATAPRGPENRHSDEGLSGLLFLWNDSVFGAERPIRVFSQREDVPLSFPLLWVDHWYSGLVTRTIGPFWRRERQAMPPSFLIFPTTPPFLGGFVILPYREDRVDDWAQRLYGTLSGLGTSPIVLDSASLSQPLKPRLFEVSKALLDKCHARLFVSDPASHPETFRCLGLGSEA